MKAKKSIRCTTAALGLLLVAALLALPALAAPAPEETAVSGPWFPETLGAGDWHACVVRTDGTLACWGLDYVGQATPPAGTFSQVCGGFLHTCGLKTDGTLACWGYDFYGQATPPAGTFRQVGAGEYHTCGLRTDATLACWGTMGPANPRRRPGPSPTSALATITAAGCGPTARSNAGGPTTRARPRPGRDL